MLDGESLLPMLPPDPPARKSDIVVSQFHGCNIAMSWYLAMDGRYKHVVLGTTAL